MNIANSEPEDLNEIIRLYGVARNFQKAKGAVPWPEFDCKMIEAEILQHRQWKILIDYKIACVWCTTFTDPQIWEERNTDPSVYIHRIASDPVFRGRNLVGEIVKWGKIYAKENGKKFIRMDTVGENFELIKYYQKCGFDFLGLSKLKDTNALPAHYHNATVSLFQISLE
jgi:hypothetical protein